MYGTRHTVYGIRYTVYGIRYTVHEVYGIRYTVYRVHSTYGTRHTVYGIEGIRYTEILLTLTYDVWVFYQFSPYRINIRVRPYIRSIKNTVYTTYGISQKVDRTRTLVHIVSYSTCRTHESHVGTLGQ
jgi:hypothetical protein